MLSFKCKNCGGETSVDSSGSLYCEYCGSKFNFQDKELLEYRTFRLQMLNYLRGLHDEQMEGESQEDSLWDHAETVCYETKDGDDVNVRYLYTYDDGVATTYLTRHHALFVFSKNKRKEAERMLRGIQALSFPPADVKGLEDCFPKLRGTYELKDDGIMLTFTRTENLFPLSMFGSLTPEHVAWIISRLENICCVLNYGGLIHGGINEESVWINPFNHHGVLMGHWWSTKRVEQAGLGTARDQDLKDIRKTADRILGIHREEAPQELTEFLRSRPGIDAYADFEAWDRVIEVGFGGRRFAKMNVDF